MGVILFIGVFVAAIYWLIKFYQSLSNDMPAGISRRSTISLDNRSVAALENPLITQVAEAELPKKIVSKIPERLPTVTLPPPIAPRDLQPEVLPNFTVAPSSIEKSLLFRVLIQVLFTIGTISADLAMGSHFAWVAMPITTAGAVWSWYRRQDAKHWLNISVSIATFALLISSIFPILLKELQVGIDSAAPAVKQTASIALGLEMVLIDLQMGLSFNLYGRKVLGYGVVISGLLMAIAAWVSQGIGFLILLAGFVAVAIPTLMLDYRSRLELKPVGIAPIATKQELPYRHLPWKYLSRLAAIALGLGLMLAVFLPNFHLPNVSLPNIPQNSEISAQGAINAEKREHGTLNSQRQSATVQTSATPSSTSVEEMAAQLFGQPGNNNYPDTIKQDNLQLPPEIASQLQQFTQKILATSPQTLNSDYARAAYLAEYLKQHHQADPQRSDTANLPHVNAKSIQQIIAKCPPDRQNCPLVASKQDVPIIYTSMLRSIGIPARLKTGDKLLEIDPKTQLYARLPVAAAPSQTEIYFPNWGWFGMDSTPDRPLLNPDARQLAQLQQQLPTTPRSFADLAASSQPQPSLQPNSRPSPVGTANTGRSSNLFSDFTSLFKPKSSTPNEAQPSLSLPPIGNNSTGQSSPNNPAPSDSTPSMSQLEFLKWEPDPLIFKIIVMVVAIGIGIAWYFDRQKQQQQQLAGLPPVERIYQSMLASLNDRGLSKLPTQTQLEYADTTSKIYHPQIAKVIREISQSYTAWRYGKQKTDIKELTKKLQFLQHLQKLAAKRERQQQIDRFKSQLGFKTRSLK